MSGVKLTIPPEIEDLFDGFTPDEMDELLTEAAEGFCGPGGVLEKHFDEGQSRWGESGEDYQDYKARRHGSREKFVKTGAAKEALTKRSPYRVIKVSKVGGVHRVQVALVRMEGGRNIYSIAQAGGKNNAGPPMRISDNLPGDVEIIRPHVDNSVRNMLRKKKLL